MRRRLLTDQLTVLPASSRVPEHHLIIYMGDIPRRETAFAGAI